MTRLLELAELCEKAEGRGKNTSRDPESAKLDCLIWMAVKWPDRKFLKFIRHRKPGLTDYGAWAARTDKGDLSVYAAPSYTYSLDAAMTLVDDVSWWRVDRETTGDCYARVNGILCQAATPALTLCAAALRARASQ